MFIRSSIPVYCIHPLWQCSDMQKPINRIILRLYLILVYTMCQNTPSEPASVQTLISTHRYGIKNFSSMFQYYCPLCSPVCTPVFFGGLYVVITHVCNDFCLVKNCVNTGDYSRNTYFCMSKLMYEQA